MASKKQRLKGKLVKQEPYVKTVYRPTVVTGDFLAEEVWDRVGPPVYLVYHFSDESLTRQTEITLGETDDRGRKIVYKPIDNDMLRKGLVIVPRTATPCTLSEVLREADEFVELCYDAREQVAPVKVFTRQAIGSWFYDRFTEDKKNDIAGAGKFAPIIAIRGTAGSGKNRLLFCIRLISYRPYYELCTSRVPSLYRPLDLWGGTLCIDEADLAYTNETSAVSQYFNSRCYGTPISRQDPKNPKNTNVFSSFGLTVFTQRRMMDDDATSTRSLPFYSMRTLKELPTIETPEMLEHGLALQDKMLYLRFKYYTTFKIDPTAWIPGIRDHRLVSGMLPLIALSKIEPSIYTDLEATVKDFAAIKIREKALSQDGLVVNYLWDLVSDGLVSLWNGNYYFTVKISVESEEGDHEETVPLTTGKMSQDFKWTAKDVRKVIHSLNLIDANKKVNPLVRVGEKKYRVIFFEAERFEMSLFDFVANYEAGSLQGILEKYTFSESKITDFDMENELKSHVGEGEKGSKCVPCVPFVPQIDGDADNSGTHGTNGTDKGGISPSPNTLKTPFLRIKIPCPSCGDTAEGEVYPTDDMATVMCAKCSSTSAIRKNLAGNWVTVNNHNGGR